MHRAIIVAAMILAALALPVNGAGVDQENLKEYGHGIIKDYSDMREGDGVEWIWLRDGLRLSEHRFAVTAFKNLTAVSDADMEEEFAKTLPKTLDGAGSKDSAAPLLRVEGAIYWAQRANRSKRWIPYAGGHLAQAGVGMELVITNEAGEIVCKIRHSGREGDQLKSAAEELIDDVTRFVADN